MAIDVVFAFVGTPRGDPDTMLVCLREKTSRRGVIFTIGDTDAEAILSVAPGVVRHGYEVHEIWAAAMTTMGVTLEQVILTGLNEEQAVQGELHFRLGDRAWSVPCHRPPIGIALALAMNAPIRIANELFAAMQPTDIPERFLGASSPKDATSTDWGDFFNTHGGDIPEA